MAVENRLQTQQSPAALPGTWKLAPGRAITLQPKEDGTFKVAHGQMWATYDGPHGGVRSESGDHIVGAGQTLRLRAGERLVVESWNWQSPSYFSWDPLPVKAVQRTPRLNAVVQPLADLRLAMAFGAGAFGRLVSGLVSVAWQMLAGRSGEAAFNAQARACRTHGAT